MCQCKKWSLKSNYSCSNLTVGWLSFSFWAARSNYLLFFEPERFQAWDFLCLVRFTATKSSPELFTYLLFSRFPGSFLWGSADGPSAAGVPDQVGLPWDPPRGSQEPRGRRAGEAAVSGNTSTREITSPKTGRPGETLRVTFSLAGWRPEEARTSWRHREYFFPPAAADGACVAASDFPFVVVV